MAAADWPEALEAALERALAAGPGPVLVLGPEGAELLLRAAMAGGAEGPRALFLAPSAPPRLPGGGDPRALKRLELRYPRSLRALCRALVTSSPPPPFLLLLAGLERFAGNGKGGGVASAGRGRGSERAAARAAALLLEASRGFGARAGPSPGRAPARLLAAMGLAPPPPRMLRALRRFFPRCVRIGPRGGGGASGSDSDGR